MGTEKRTLGGRERTPKGGGAGWERSRDPEFALTCAGGRRLLALGAHRGAPLAPPPAAPALSRGRVRGAGVALGSRAGAWTEAHGPAHAPSGRGPPRAPSPADFGVRKSARGLRGSAERWARSFDGGAMRPVARARAKHLRGQGLGMGGARGKSPRLLQTSPRPRTRKTSSSATRTGHRIEQRPTEAETHFLSRSVPRRDWISRLRSLSQGLWRPAPSATVPQCPGSGRTWEAPPSRRRLGAQVRYGPRGQTGNTHALQARLSDLAHSGTSLRPERLRRLVPTVSP